MLRRFLLSLFVALLPIGWCCAAEGKLTWSELPRLPDKLGFAGPFVGTHHGALLVAGGANFPEKPPWEGGVKVWYDSVFVLDEPDGAWRNAGRLPRPLGYGISVSTQDGVVCVGGSDAERHYADVVLLSWEDGKIRVSPLPGLPKACANFCGAMLDNSVYVAGGIETPSSTQALRTFWSLDLGESKPQWRELEPWPGPARMLAVAAVQNGSFFLASGAELTGDAQGKPARRYLKDLYRYQPSTGWSRLADMPHAAVAAPTPAPAMGESGFLILGGDDGLLLNFQPPEKHPGFPKTILAYDILADRWNRFEDMPAAHVTTTLVRWQDRFVIPSGEIRPGVRSPVVWAFTAGLFTNLQ